MSAVRRALPGLLLAALGVTGLTACTGDDASPPAAPTPTLTSLADLAPDLTVVRAGFCPRVAPKAVETALGAPPEESATWRNGDRAEIAPGTRDVVHEYGCSWTAADGTQARAWVFAPPVTAEQAGRLADGAERADGCSRLAGAASYGEPSTAVTCTRDGRTTTSYVGLFGDAWLSCSLETAATPKPARVDHWCANVVAAAASS